MYMATTPYDLLYDGQIYMDHIIFGEWKHLPLD